MARLVLEIGGTRRGGQARAGAVRLVLLRACRHDDTLGNSCR